MIYKLLFDNAINLVRADRERTGIGTLGEKTLHAVLKYYYEPDAFYHEKKINGFFADIERDGHIYEIQTRSFERLSKKLSVFLKDYRVTVVYPVPSHKWLVWVDGATGETTKKRKSPKIGLPCDVLYELYKIKNHLLNENFSVLILEMELLEYRNLDGWNETKKRGSTRFERIPLELIDETRIDTPRDYQKLIPHDLPQEFTVKDYAKAFNRNIKFAGTAMNVLFNVGAVERIGKRGNAYIYRINNNI